MCHRQCSYQCSCSRGQVCCYPSVWELGGAGFIITNTHKLSFDETFFCCLDVRNKEQSTITSFKLLSFSHVELIYATYLCVCVCVSMHLCLLPCTNIFFLNLAVLVIIQIKVWIKSYVKSYCLYKIILNVCLCATILEVFYSVLLSGSVMSVFVLLLLFLLNCNSFKGECCIQYAITQIVCVH